MTFSAPADGRPVSIDRDTVLESFTCSHSGGCVISTDPARTVTNTLATPTDAQLNNVIGASKSTAQISAAFLLSAGEMIFVSSGAAGVVLLLFRDLLVFS